MIENFGKILSQIKISSSKPEIYTPGTDVFWTNEYIAKKILNTHLDFKSEKASKRIETINGEVDFIDEIVHLHKNRKLIDLGCGPGTYCERFYNKGAYVTGVDFSGNSIEYAMKSAKEKNMEIKYLNRDYLELEFESEYDVACLIFFDFATFSMDNTHKLLDTVNKMLKKHGYFIFDIRTIYDFEIPVKKNWYVDENGFWGKGFNLVLEEFFEYGDRETILFQATVVDSSADVEIYRIYENFYTLAKIERLLEMHGFKIEHIFEDLRGKEYTDFSKRMGIFAKKAG